MASKIIAEYNDIKAVADAIRTKKNITGDMLLKDMPSNVLSIEGGEQVSNEVTSGNSHMMTDATPAVNGTNLRLNGQHTEDVMMRNGSWNIIDTPLSNLGDASTDDVVEGVTFTSTAGVKKTGTFTIEDEVTAQENLIVQISAALEGKSAGGGSSVETCAVTISTDDGDLKWITYASVQNGQIIYNTIETLQNGNSITLENVVKNSIITIFRTGSSSGGCTGGNSGVFDYNKYQGWLIDESCTLSYISSVEDL